MNIENSEMSSGYDQTLIFQSKMDELNSEKSENVFNEDDEDLITLSGCGQITKWKFPAKQKSCPVQNYCGMMFEKRSDAIAHFNERHAQKSILCSICNEPICAKYKISFVYHYKRLHPNVDVPFGLDEKHVKNSSNLKGLGTPAQWKFFPKNILNCPVRGCGLMFQTRLDVIDHYAEKHDDNFTICTICNKPISTQHLKSHSYGHSKHPTKPMVNGTVVMETGNKNQTAMIALSPNVKTTNILNEEEEEEEEEEEDMITLSGCGKITKWKFPTDKKRCPVIKCGLRFEQLSGVIAHYKERHARKSILCSICNKPICAKYEINFVNHYKRMHPNVDVPFGLDRRNSITSSNVLNEEDDEWITLEGCDQITQWKFPANKKRCPVISCGQEFEKRSEAIAHYKEQHAQVSILCPICNKPIMSRRHCKFVWHFKRMHPNRKIPYGLKTKRSKKLKKKSISRKITEFRCERCPIVFTSNANLTRHVERYHSTKVLLCFSKECKFESKSAKEMQEHWSKTHQAEAGSSTSEFQVAEVAANDALLIPLYSDNFSPLDESTNNNDRSVIWSGRIRNHGNGVKRSASNEFSDENERNKRQKLVSESNLNLYGDGCKKLSVSHDSLHIEDTDIAIGAEIEENIISSISKPIDVSDYELFSISDASEEMDLDFSDVEPCATFSISDNFLKQEHVRVKNVLMMIPKLPTIDISSDSETEI